MRRNASGPSSWPSSEPRYEADRARRQFEAVEPENRLVARSVEAAWEAALGEVRRAEADLTAQRARRPTALTAEELAWVSRAGADVRAIFGAQTTTHRERKQLLRALIAEVVVTVRKEERQAGVRILWEGGASTDLTMELNRPGGHARATPEETVELVRKLAASYEDATIAMVLGRQRQILPDLIHHMCQRESLPSVVILRGIGGNFIDSRLEVLGWPLVHIRIGGGLAAQRKPVKAWFAAEDTAIGLVFAFGGMDNALVVGIVAAERILGVSKVTIYRWLRDGFITGTQVVPGGPWHIPIDDALRSKVVGEVPVGWVGLDQAAQTLGVARQTVLDRIRRGELRAVHVNRGRRKGLAIEVAPPPGDSLLGPVS